ncbi:unnamed protein product [Menidia menidia]|uniref:(Atlantic silverside) hypothetical protein n=1 Tax=Menidia menidia TaxID=238744 RepID=A0A8S4BIG5_9TELE|nr:unnamed protein product [Menidia menidia]
MRAIVEQRMHLLQLCKNIFQVRPPRTCSSRVFGMGTQPVSWPVAAAERDHRTGLDRTGPDRTGARSSATAAADEAAARSGAGGGSQAVDVASERG